MKRMLIQTTEFSKDIKRLIARNKITEDDFNNFKKELTEDPKKGAVISKTGGVRKIRLKSASKGKSGGYRVCYLDIEEKFFLFLISLYPKNEQEDLTEAEKKELKQISEAIKEKYRR